MKGSILRWTAVGCLSLGGFMPAVVFGETLKLAVLDHQSGRPIPARVHLLDARHEPVHPPDLPFWRDHFACPGQVTLQLPVGSYTCQIARGPEYRPATRTFELTAGQPLELTVRLERLANLAREGWWSGELHVHRPLEQIELLMRAEDLHIAPVITWWNQQSLWLNRPLPKQPVVRFDGDRYYHLMAGEDERGGGALMYFNLPRPLHIRGAKREYPSSVKFLRQAKAQAHADRTSEAPVWVDIEKPFWWDTPIWLATGLVDSVGLAHNHMQRRGVLDSEAWGRPRDRNRYPGPRGNGLWTQDVYYHILNCGLRLPPTAGSASGVLPNPLGYNRVYVHLDEGFDYARWWRGLREGRVFVSNGPLLRVRANGQWPGHVFKTRGPLQVRFDVRLDSNDPIERLEVVRNGRVELMPFPSVMTIQESGWFLVRAIAAVTNTFRFASTGPWYVEIDGQPMQPSARSVRFFLEWTRERAARVAQALPDERQRAEVLEPIKAAERFWEAKLAQAARTVEVMGEVVDADTESPLPARVYLQGANGRWYFPESAHPAGTALRYERRNWINPHAVEYHTTLSAHPFRVELPPGRYTITVERGKEYRPLHRAFEVADKPLQLRLPLKRWVNMAARGWYSGDTHVHRTPAELPNLMLAEDLNVAFPLTYWVTRAFAPPTQGDKNTAVEAARPEVVHVDDTHVFWPLNTEYELFTVNGRRHTLGAVFVLGHHEALTLGAPPVGPIGDLAHRQGALLDLDKHDWPWAMMLVPVMGVDLYELANNHHWRTVFSMTNWSTMPADYMAIPTTNRGGDERAWTLYTFENYYALLDCGFRLQPSAGTANGVHPVPLGFGRVYVHLPEGFSFAAWLKGLKAGHSFVTTGPVLLARIERGRVTGTVLSEQPVKQVEVIVNGEVTRRLALRPHRNEEGAWQGDFQTALSLHGTSWVAVRCFEERDNGRFRFAHTAPRWFDVPGEPLRPRREEVQFLIQRVRDQIDRSGAVLPPEAMKEYSQALAAYQRLLEVAR